MKRMTPYDRSWIIVGCLALAPMLGCTTECAPLAEEVAQSGGGSSGGGDTSRADTSADTALEDTSGGATDHDPATAGAFGYAMYVWTEAFDATVAGCGEAELVAWDWDADAHCYTPTWDTAPRRQWLWDTANRPGREVGRLFISGTKTALKAAYLAQDCAAPGLEPIKALLAEGHCTVPGVALHALFADSDLEVSERNHIPYVVWFNDHCASSPAERFDGVAINNEAWHQLKCADATAQRTYLDRLQAIANAAAQQQHGDLRTHYSIGHHWNACDGTDFTLNWDGGDKPPTHHMIDVFDSIDVQVAHVSASVTHERAQRAGYDYADAQGKQVYLTAYTNRSAPADCTTTHFPYDCSYTWSNSRRSDAYMMEAMFDSYAASPVPNAVGCIHYFRGVYSSGGHPDWPSYAGGSATACR